MHHGTSRIPRLDLRRTPASFVFSALCLACLAASPPAETLTPEAFAAPAEDPGSIAGTVRSEGGATVAGAEVALVDLRLRTTTDSEGRFRFEAVAPGTYLLEAFSPEAGGGVGRAAVVSGEETELDLALELSHVRDSVVVTASGAARSTLELARPASVLDGDALAFRLQPSLGETLAQQPGVSSTFFGPGASRPVIRGLGGDRVQMLDGGIGTGDASATSADHAVSIDPLSAERIEILRGPATLLYGSSAIGGVVNVLDGRIPHYRAESKLRGTADLRAGSAADALTGALDLGGGAGAWAWSLTALSRGTGDYDAPGSTVPNTDLATESAGLGVSYFGAAGSLGLAASGYDSNYGIPGEPVRIDLTQRRFDLRGEVNRPFGPFQGLKVRAGAVDYEHDELEGEEVGTSFFTDSWETRFELVQAPRGPLTGSVGLQVRATELEAVGEEAFLPPVETTSWALFAFEEVERGTLRYQLGARFESQDTEARLTGAPERSFDGVSASLGVVWQPRKDYSVGLSVARSVKLPNGQELYSEGPHAATRTFEVGDPDLGRESSLGFDLALRKLTGRVTGEISFFTNDFSDFIFQAFTGAEEDGLPVVLSSQADAALRGAELEARVALFEKAAHHLDLELSGDLVDAELSGGENLPRIPPRRFAMGLHYHGDRLQALLEARRVAAQNDVATNETPTPGHTLLNASIGYRFTWGGQILDVLLRGTNLTDEDARNHVSFLKDEAPLPGRDVGISLRLWF